MGQPVLFHSRAPWGPRPLCQDLDAAVCQAHPQPPAQSCQAPHALAHVLHGSSHGLPQWRASMPLLNHASSVAMQGCSQRRAHDTLEPFLQCNNKTSLSGSAGNVTSMRVRNSREQTFFQTSRPRAV